MGQTNIWNIIKIRERSKRQITRKHWWRNYFKTRAPMYIYSVKRKSIWKWSKLGRGTNWDDALEQALYNIAFPFAVFQSLRTTVAKDIHTHLRLDHSIIIAKGPTKQFHWPVIWWPRHGPTFIYFKSTIITFRCTCVLCIWFVM